MSRKSCFHLGHADRHSGYGPGNEWAGWPRRLAGVEGAPRFDPGREPPVQDGGPGVSEVAQHPPKPRGEHSRGIVVGDHRAVGSDSESAEDFGDPRDRRQRMAPVGPGLPN